MSPTELERIGVGGVRVNRMRASAMDSVLELVLWTELTLDADWLPGCLFGVLRSRTVGWGVFQLVIDLACIASLNDVQLVVGGTIECTAEAHSWFGVGVTA